MEFDDWLSNILGVKTNDVRDLLKDPTGTQFLMAWSLFESKCFSGYMTGDKIEDFAKLLVQGTFRCEAITEVASYFHQRYQDSTLLNSLTQNRDRVLIKRMNSILKTSLRNLHEEDLVFLVTFVAYRFRNNLFHGTKGIPSWPKYKEQIARCTGAIQSFVSNVVQNVPSVQKSLGV